MPVTAQDKENFSKELFDRILSADLIRAMAKKSLMAKPVKEESPFQIKIGLPPVFLYVKKEIIDVDVVAGGTPYDFVVIPKIHIALSVTPLLPVPILPPSVVSLVALPKIKVKFYPVRPLGLGYELTPPEATESDIGFDVELISFEYFGFLRSAIRDEIKKVILEKTKNSMNNVVDLLSKFQGAITVNKDGESPVFAQQTISSAYEEALHPELADGLGIGVGNAVVKKGGSNAYLYTDWVIRNLSTRPMLIRISQFIPTFTSSSNGTPLPMILLPGMKVEFTGEHYPYAVTGDKMNFGFAPDGKTTVWSRTLDIKK
jgi:hypothetical protein